MVLSIHKLTKIIHPSIKLLDSPHKEDPLGTLLLRAPAVGMQTLPFCRSVLFLQSPIQALI